MGQTERFVQTVKTMIKKSKDPYKSMLDYRNSPLEGIGLSPAQLHLGRRLKSNLPATATALKPAVNPANIVRKGHMKRQSRQKYYYNKQFAGKSLKKLNTGDTIMIDKHDSKLVPGSVIKQHSTPRSYIVETLGGKKLRRNRRHLKQTGANFREEEYIPEYIVPTGNNSLLNQSTSQQLVSQQSASQQSPSHQSSSQQTNDNLSSQSTHTSQSVQSESQERRYETRSGRSVKPPNRYGDFVFDGKVNAIKEEKVSEIFV